MIPETWPNLVTMFFDQAERLADKPFLWAKRDGAYRAITWRETATQVVALARRLKDLGIEPGDRVVIVSENRPEWLISDMAIMAVGGISTPAYVTNTENDHLHILENSGAKGAIVSTGRIATRFLPAAHKAPSLDFVISMEPPKLSQNLSVEIHDWSESLSLGEQGDADIVGNAGQWRRDDVACIIYTSGTGGAPKGVMLHHGAMLHNCAGANDAISEFGLENEVFLSFLPLSHSYEHSAGQFFPISIGAQIYYAEGMETLATNMIEARPTIMISVPRLYETMRGRIMRGVERQGGLKAKLFLKTVELGQKHYHDPKSLTIGERLTNKALDFLVRKKVAERFGGRIKAMVSGGGPLNPDVGLYFHALGVCIMQGYGQTESGPVSNVNRPNAPKMHTVGPPLIATEVRIADDGEILLRGELVMKGYWQDPDLTAETIKDGWLHTGDIGVVDDDGYLQITDRKKDIIVNSGGDNVSPQRVEGILTLEPEIAQAMVYGDRRSYLVGLIVPDQGWLASWAQENGKGTNLDVLYDDPDLATALSGVVSKVNETLSALEKVRKFTVTTQAFSIDNEQMTPTMKVRRHAVKEVYGERLDALYG